jgi:hypothetical protein
MQEEGVNNGHKSQEYGSVMRSASYLYAFRNGVAELKRPLETVFVRRQLAVIR